MEYGRKCQKYIQKNDFSYSFSLSSDSKAKLKEYKEQYCILRAQTKTTKFNKYDNKKSNSKNINVIIFILM